MTDPGLMLGNQLCFAVYSTAHAFTRLYKPFLDGLGLTYPQYLVMMVLWEGDGLTVKALGERLHLDSGTLTPLLKRLESAGLISRSRDLQDERQLCVTLTTAGRDLHDQAKDVPPKILAATGCGLPELARLRDELLALRSRMDEYVAP